MNTPPFPDITPWPPVRWTPPLSDPWPNVYDVFAPVIRRVWQAAFGHTPEEWQEQAVRLATELFPRGHAREGTLRFREFVISLGRQNGKTEIAAILGLLFMLWKQRPLVVGLATSAEQARLVYDRTMSVIRATPALRARFPRLTETRGIRSTTGGKYEIKAAKSAALQGLPVDAGLVDELHILALSLWSDIVSGMGSRPDTLAFGITTAGDEDSELLLFLYERGEEAIRRGDATRFGFLLWEAPDSTLPADDETFGRYLAYANPSVASGRIDLEIAIEDVRGLPEPDAIRYRMNRFIKSEATFMSAELWGRGLTSEPFPTGVRPIFTFDRTPEWEYGSIGVFAKRDDGTIYCDLVASLVRPTLEQFAAIAGRLSRHDPITFGMDGYQLRDLGKELERRGLPVTITTQSEAINAASMFYAKTVQGKLRHPGHPLLYAQIPRAVRKNMSDGGFKIVRAGGEIDAVMSHVTGVYLAETRREESIQIFTL